MSLYTFHASNALDTAEKIIPDTVNKNLKPHEKFAIKHLPDGALMPFLSEGNQKLLKNYCSAVDGYNKFKQNFKQNEYSIQAYQNYCNNTNGGRKKKTQKKRKYKRNRKTIRV